MNISELDLEMLRNAGIRAGDILYFEFSGDTNTGENRNLAVKLQSLIGRDGLLVVPTCTSQQGIPKPVFNPVNTASEMGPFSEYFRHQPGVFRSNHPTHSVAAWGKGAEAFTRGHKYAYGRQSPWGESALGFASPWEKLYQSNAWGILIEPDWSISPLLHYVAACYAEKNQNITKQSVFPHFAPSWLEENFSRSAGAWEGMIDAKRIRVFRVQKMVSGLLNALEQEAQACTGDPAFLDWLETRRWVEQNGCLLAGVSKTIITPGIPFPRWEGKPMTGVFRDLYARVLFLQSGQKRFALVLCDLIGITADITCAIRQQVADSIPDHPPVIMVACTHAHSTPDTIGAGYADSTMLTQLVDQIVNGILEASRQTAHL